MGGGQGGCERRIEVFVKIKKKIVFLGVGGGSRGGGSGWGGQGGCERRIEVLGKIHKKKLRGGGGASGKRGVRWGARVDGGVRVDGNAMLGVGGDLGMCTYNLGFMEKK